MADSARGGIYLDGATGRYHDAHGNYIEEKEALKRLDEFDEQQKAAGKPTREEELQQREDQIAASENQRRGALGNVPVEPGKIDRTPVKAGRPVRKLTAEQEAGLRDAEIAAGGIARDDRTATAGSSSESGGTGAPEKDPNAPGPKAGGQNS